ncbi:MAG: hypothetical protein EA402_07535 [Planctomycetota bacterium]|nr:MAG: hypothetical protein EA402_07535 [Planctomycetota bacterium]
MVPLARMPTCYIIAGPNGAGKTTFAMHYLPAVVQCRRFINADLIAAGLSPLAPATEQATASRLFLQEIEHAIAAESDFAFETTLAGRGHLKRIQRLQNNGWRIHLLYLALPSVTASLRRVAERVAHGGHHIPTPDIERRFPRSLENLFTHFVPLVDRVLCYLNTENEPKLIFEASSGQTRVHDAEWFARLHQEIV